MLSSAFAKRPVTVADSCLRMYANKRVVAFYSKYAALEKPEAAILRQLAPRLGSMRMLDIGVGGGRITEHFAWRVRSYHGIDLIPEMVSSCRGRFAGRIPGECFEVRDMRALDAYPANAFDFVLNAFNGIDHLAHAERGPFLAQVRRVLAPGGVFCFSTHNILSLASYLEGRADWTRPGFWRRPRQAMKTLRQRARFLKLNRRVLAQYSTADHVVINNGAHGDFGVQIYYIRTGAQLAALRRAGFERISVYSLDSGAELAADQAEAAADRWLYYLCS